MKSHHPHTIVVVDVGDGGSRIAAVLRDEGHEVREAGTAEVALAAEGADLIVLEGGVPEAAALEVYRGLEADPATAATPVLHLRPAPPLDPAHLAAMVTALLRARRAERAQLEAAQLRAVTALANATAHEINNPLTIVTGQLELLAREQPTLAARVRSVCDAAYRIADVVTRMRRITRLRVVCDAANLPEMLDLDASSAPPSLAETPAPARPAP